MITGATGFVGSALVDHYVSRGYSVLGTVSPRWTRSRGSGSRRSLVQVDLRELHQVQEVLNTTRPEVVCHLAAQSSVSTSWQDPMGTLMDNARMQFNVLEAVAEITPQARVLVVGSSDEYGNVGPNDNPVTEYHPLRPNSPYALSKTVQDLMGLQYAEAGRAQVVRVRPFLQLGPRRSSHFAVGSFARQIAEIEAGVRAPTLEVGELDLCRDFTDVRDVANACALAIERGSSGDVFNIASGDGHTLREIVEYMCDAANIRPDVVTDPSLLRHGEAPKIVGSSQKLQDLTGWKPRFSFRESVTDTLGYWQKRVRNGAGKEKTEIQ